MPYLLQIFFNLSLHVCYNYVPCEFFVEVFAFLLVVVTIIIIIIIFITTVVVAGVVMLTFFNFILSNAHGGT